MSGAGESGAHEDTPIFDALRDALRRTLDDPALRERLIASGRDRAGEFSMQRLAHRYRKLYERALVPAG